MPRYRVLEDQPGRVVLGARRAALVFDRDGIVLRPRWLATRISRAAIDRLQLTVTARHEIALAIRHATRWSIREARSTFRVRDLDVDTEALDLAFRIARALGLPGFAVHPGRTVELLPRGPVADSPYRDGAIVLAPAVRSIDELAGAMRGVPELRAPATYDRDRARFVEPAQPVGDVTAGETIASVEVRAWAPDRIALATPRRLTRMQQAWHAVVGAGFVVGALAFAALFGAGFEGCRRWTTDVLDEPGSAFVEWKDYLAFGVVVAMLVALLLVALGGVITAVDLARATVRGIRNDERYLTAREITYDRTELVIAWGGARLALPATDLRSVVLRAHPSTIVKTQVWSELLVETADDEVLVLVAPPAEPRAHQELERLAIGLARVLDVPWQIEPAAT